MGGNFLAELLEEVLSDRLGIVEEIPVMEIHIFTGARVEVVVPFADEAAIALETFLDCFPIKSFVGGAPPW